MASGLAIRVHKEILDCYLNATNITAPTNIYVSLHTADPGDGEPAVTSNEVSGNNYARKLHNAWDAAADDGDTGPVYVLNDGVVTFAQATGGAWGTITHAGLWTSLAGTGTADYLGRAELSSSRTISEGDTASFADEAFRVEIDETT